MTPVRPVVLLLILIGSQAALGGEPVPATASDHSSTREIPMFKLLNPDTMFKPTAGYSQAVEITDGKIVYIAGQVAQDKAGNLVGKDDFRAQLQQVFENLKAAVEPAGGTFTNIVKLNWYCAESVDLAQMPLVREIRDRYVDTAHPPTSTFVVVKRLVRPEWLIEVDAVAVIKK
jgi:enamine deaminase RidA (YjgF/YER057c/UK114 family)